MINARGLFKSNGTLVLVDLMRKPHGSIGEMFGIFDGWWVAQEEQGGTILCRMKSAGTRSLGKPISLVSMPRSGTMKET
jgi:hypothetical protein